MAMWRTTLLYLLVFGLSSNVATADISVPVSNVRPLPLKGGSTVGTALQLFQQSCPEMTQPTAKVIVSSYYNTSQDTAVAGSKFYASSDSFVRAAIDAWAQHQNLVLRPDVVWYEILAQLNLYATKHADELSSLFAKPQDQETILLEGSWQSVINSFQSEIQTRVKTDWLERWITPRFSTSTANDNTTAAVLMLGVMQQYFTFTGGIICGLPSIKLLGEREDWVALLAKLENLHYFGTEPTQYAKNLYPILSMFVKTWDEPNSDQVRSFWNKIVRADKVFTCGAGPIEYDVSGWITGFMHWSASGDLLVPGDSPGAPDATTLGGISYPRVNLNQLPVGYVKLPVKVVDYPTRGTNSIAYALAGNIGIARVPGMPGGSGVLAQPLSTWFLYGPVDLNLTSSQRDVGSRSELQSIYQGFRTNCPKGG